jgi:phosphoglycerate dehydrogenase-like enzyme
MSPSAERGPRVLVTDHVFGGLDAERELLAPLGAELVLAESAAEDDLLRLIAPGTDALLVCFAPVGPRVVEAAADAGCRIIARYGIGVDNVDIDTATDRGIPVTNVPDYCLDEVADHALALLLAAARVAPLGYAVTGYDPHVADWPDGIARAGSAAEAVADADAVSLQDGRLGAVGLDVTDPEPLPAGHPLRDHPRAVITPHMAFYSVEAEAELQRRAVQEVVRALRGEPLDRQVNVPAAHA